MMEIFFVPLTLEYYNAYARLIVHAQRFFIISHKVYAPAVKPAHIFLIIKRERIKVKNFLCIV